MKIEEIRKKFGFNQNEMAEKMNISQSTYARFERENTKIDLERLQVFANAVGMSFIDVITYPDKYINITEIRDELFKTEPEVIVQVKVAKSKKDEILKSIFGENAELII